MDLDSRTYFKLNHVSYGDENFEKYGRIVDAIWPLTKRRDHETPEMWCSRIHDPFRKILEENPRILSKNGYIVMCGKLYENEKVHTGQPTDYIYCSVCDSLVFIRGTGDNPCIYHDSHLKRCISGNTISNDHARRKEILQSIDRREFHIWQYKQYILKEEVKINRLRLELFSQSTSHSEKDKLASVSYDHDANFIASYENYAQSKATVAKNTMPSVSNFEPACISPARQRSASAPEIRNLWNNQSNMPNISSRTTLGDLAEAYFNSVRTNAGRK